MKIGIKVCAILSLLIPSMPAHAGWGVSWTFAGNSGIISDGSSFSSPKAPSGTQVAFIQDTSSVEQSFNATADGRYVVSWQCAPRWWIDTDHDYDVMIDGKAVMRMNSGAVPNRNAYNPLSIAVDLTAGPHKLRFQGVNSKGGDHTSFLDSVTITPPATVTVATPLLANGGFDAVAYAAGSFRYRPPATTTPEAKLAEAKVTTSGRAIFCRLVAVKNGSTMPIVALSTPPTIKVNGSVVAPPSLVSTPDHDGFMLMLAADVNVKASDAVTLSAPLAWATVPDDFADAISDFAAEVCTGRSWIGTESVQPTLRLGLNIGDGTYWDNSSVVKNLRVKMGYWFNGGVTEVDNRGFPAKLDRDTVIAPLISDDGVNGLDATGIPTPEGLYAVGWGLSGGSTAACSLIGFGDSDVTERTDLANPGGADGRGHVRVFNFKRKPSAVTTAFTVALQITDQAHAPKFSYLVMYGPSDFKVKDNTPTVLDDVDDTAAVSEVARSRLAGGLGTARGGENIGYQLESCAAEPEDIIDEGRFSWLGSNNRGWRVSYKQVRPWTPQNSPYCYSPLFGEQYPATLATALDAPARGTKQVVQVTDAATAPVFEGLVLQAGAERMRVLSVAGTAVTIERGSESTSPAAFPVGPIQVSGRTALTSLDAFGPGRRQVIEVVTTAPHHLRTGGHPMFDGIGWGPWTMADGSKSLNGYSLRNWFLGAFVTAPDRYVISIPNGPNAANTTLAAAADLDPANSYSSVFIPPGPSDPTSAYARMLGSLGADIHIFFPYAASDSYVDAMARVAAKNLPSGRRLYFEYLNEPWNWSYPIAHTQVATSWMIGRRQGMFWQVRRTGQILKRIRARFAEAGRDPAGVRSLLNTQVVLNGQPIREIVKQSIDEGLPPPDIAVAPYVDPVDVHPAYARAMDSAGGADRAIDLYIWNLAYNHNKDLASNSTGNLAANRSVLDAVNKEFGTACELYAYEGGVANPCPIAQTTLSADVAADATALPVRDASPFAPGQSLRVGGEWVSVKSTAAGVLTVDRARFGTTAVAYKAGGAIRNAYVEQGRDITYHPNFRLAELDQFAIWQKYLDRICINGFNARWFAGFYQWSMYHWYGQLPGKGDGSDGRADNRLCLATPGLPGSKAANVNQDLMNVSVRGQALVEWNTAASKPPPPKPTAPPVPTGLVAKATSPTSVDLSWSASAMATGYSVQRSPDGSAWAAVATSAGTTYADPGLTGGMSYSYRVAATNAAGTSAYGPAVVVTMPIPPSPPPDISAQAADVNAKAIAVGDAVAALTAQVDALKVATKKLVEDTAKKP